MNRISLRVGVYEFGFSPSETMTLSPPVGSLWRGLMGLQLRRMSDDEAPAPGDLPEWIRPSALYEYFMTTPPPPDAAAMRLYPHVPHPYALSCEWRMTPLQLKPGDIHHIRIRLFGRANDLLKVIALALSRAARQGLGGNRIPMRLMDIHARDLDGGESTRLFAPGETFHTPNPVVPPVPESLSPLVEVSFISPLRMQHKGRLMRPGNFSPSAFLINIIRRISMLQLFHEGSKLQADYSFLRSRAAAIVVRRSNLSWVEQRRYSARQKREIPLGGIMGSVTLDFSKAGELLPWIWTGQHLQTGKGTVFGLGQFKIGNAV